MKALAKFIAGLAGIAIGGVIIGVFLGGESGSGEEQLTVAEGTAAPVAQSVEERTWLPRPTEQAAVFGNEEAPIYNPSYVGVDGDGNVYVLDRGGSRVKKFAPTGEFMTAFGNGSGEGPGEFSMITDMDVAQDGRVVVTDSENARLTTFGPEDRSIKMASMRRAPYRLALVGRDQAVSMPMPGSQDEFLSLIDIDGDKVDQFGTLIENQQKNALALDSRLVGTEGGVAYFAPRKVGWVGAYDRDGTLRFLRQTIDAHELPMVIRQGSVRYVDRSAPTVTYGASVSSDGFHVHTGADSSGTRISVLDTYDLQTGDYRYSTRIPPGKSRFAYMDDDRVYVVNDTSVIAWSRRMP
jgi:DNA-binding beta-propeller fold protein YncE